MWEIFSNKGWINEFLFSSPSEIFSLFKTYFSLYKNKQKSEEKTLKARNISRATKKLYLCKKK